MTGTLYITGDERADALLNADGTALAKFEDREIAFAAVRQNDMEPVSVH